LCVVFIWVKGGQEIGRFFLPQYFLKFELPWRGFVKSINKMSNKKESEFLREMSYEDTQEMFMFIMLFQCYKEKIVELKDKFEWYYEQYMQMLEAEESNFTDWIAKVRSMHKDIAEQLGQHIPITR
jgi:hypothetical protein